MTSSLDSSEVLGRGRTADVTALGKEKVLKLYKDWMPLAAVEQEYKVTRTAFAAGLPAPQAYELIEQEGRFGIIFERIYGNSLMKELQDHPFSLGVIAKKLAILHAKINQIQAPEELPSQFNQILRNINHTDALDENEKEMIRSRLSTLPGGKCLCHGDFHPDNVLITEKGPVIIDWMTGSQGSAEGDFSRTLMIMQTSSMPSNIPWLKTGILVTFRHLLVENYRRSYLQQMPFSAVELDAWKLPILAARLVEVNDYPREKQKILSQVHFILYGKADRV